MMKISVAEKLARLIKDYPNLIRCQPEIAAAFYAMRDCFTMGGKLLVCGNGGSAADSEHIVGELMKGFQLRREIKAEDRKRLQAAYPDNGEYLANKLQSALAAFSLVSQTALNSAFSNDIDPDMIYAQQIYGYGKQSDVLVAISTSGNSANIVNAVMVAKVFAIKTVGLTGETGGRLKDYCDILIRVPAWETFRIQEYHLPIYHTLCAMLEDEFFR